MRIFIMNDPYVLGCLSVGFSMKSGGARRPPVMLQALRRTEPN
ncbi:hypothetical protein HCH_03382 [Hahella chejuensis KCTC 2396]|uniref:Uncharacterized protein n=1 Tax=Hahella chejuensis (strain KCTC 2396) TaxID=349521 RepID=Q2SGU2_HAHCH|nr:hypothetical protein HCH_03382 [Hahella chejuensis KCTC 2396]